MNQTTGADNFLNTTIIECLADDIAPIAKSLTEISIFYTQVQSNSFENSLLGRRGRIGLLESDREAFQECLVKHVGADKATIIRTLTLGVCGGNHIKPRSRFYEASNLFQEDTFTFQNRLKTQDFIGSKVNLIEKQYGTTLKCFDDWTIMPRSFTIHKAKSTNQIVLIGFDSHIHPNHFTFQLSTRLLHTKRFAITRKTRNERRVKETGLNNAFNVSKITKLDEGIIFIGNKVLLMVGKNGNTLKRTLDFFYFILCDFEVPLTTTNLMMRKFVAYGLVVKTTRGTKTFEVARSDFRTIEFLDAFNKLLVVHGGFTRHNVVRSFCLTEVIIQQKRGSWDPLWTV